MLIPMNFTPGQNQFHLLPWNMRPILAKGGVYEPLKDERFFKERLTIIGDAVAWDIAGNRDPALCIDLDPFMIHDQSMVDDPLAH